MGEADPEVRISSEQHKRVAASLLVIFTDEGEREALQRVIATAPSKYFYIMDGLDKVRETKHRIVFSGEYKGQGIKNRTTNKKVLREALRSQAEKFKEVDRIVEKENERLAKTGSKERVPPRKVYPSIPVVIVHLYYPTKGCLMAEVERSPTFWTMALNYAPQFYVHLILDFDDEADEIALHYGKVVYPPLTEKETAEVFEKVKTMPFIPVGFTPDGKTVFMNGSRTRNGALDEINTKKGKATQEIAAEKKARKERTLCASSAAADISPEPRGAPVPNLLSSSSSSADAVVDAETSE